MVNALDKDFLKFTHIYMSGEKGEFFLICTDYF